MAPPRSTEPRNFGLTVLGLWLLMAVGFGASGILPTLPMPAPPLILAALTAFALVLGLRSPLRGWIAMLDPRWLVAVHLTRFVGFYFLVLYDRGELPRGPGLYGGWGDIVVATLAVLVLLFTGPLLTARERLILAVWNVLGLAGILVVTAAAARAWLADPGSMAALLRLPLSLLPTYVVPLVLATHVLLFVRLRAAPPPSP